MNLKKRTTLSIAALALVAAVLGGSSAAARTSGGLDAGPAQARTAASATPIAPARPVTPAVAVSLDLCATTGTVTLPGAVTVPVWGYAPDACAGAPVQVPGPAIVVNEGDTVTVNLHNNLAEASGLLFRAQAMIPDTAGAPPAGGTKSYTFTATNPGTYLYEAALLPNAQNQVAMGLYGALIVRPAASATQAYANPSTAFNDEAVIVLSEIDPALNTSAAPAAFDMRNYAPKYRLINGQPYPNTVPIPTLAGNKVLLRYLNAGMENHSMGVLGMHQTVIAIDGSPFSMSHRMVAETVAPGQTADTIVTIPALATAGSQFALFEGSMALRNSNAAGMGGMLTFLSVGGIPGGPDTTGPATTGVAIVLSPGSASLTATVSDAASGGSNVMAAEYFIDTVGAAGTGLALAATDSTFDSPTEAVNATLVPPSGNHTIYVRGQDAALNWGPVNSVQLSLDTTGPASTGLAVTPNPSTGSLDVALSGTGNDQATGNNNVTAAEYFIDALGTEAPGTGTPMTLNQVAPVASLNATISAAIMGALAEGPHLVSVRSQDALGNWGALSTVTLLVDRTGPATSSILVAPNPNNGTLGVASNTLAVRVTATITDGAANVSTGEGFIDTVGPNGTGFPLVPSDGVFNSLAEVGYGDIPLSTVVLLGEGPHTIYIHGKDSAGNWGAASTATLTIDETRPVVSGVSASPNPTAGAATFTLTASATDGGAVPSNIAMAEWFEGADPGAGGGSAMAAADAGFDSTTEGLTATVNVVTAGWTVGNHTVNVRARDAAGNWSLPVSTVVNVTLPEAIFADGFESGNLSAWNGGATGPGISVTAAAAMVGAYGMQITMAGNSPRYVTDNTPALDSSYHARFYFNPHGAITGNTQQDILAGRNQAGTTIFRVQYRRTNAGGGTYQVRGSVQRAGGTSTTNWVTITNNAAHSIEIAWQAGASVPFGFYVDGTLRQTLTVNTSAAAFLLDSVRLGPSAGLVGAASGTMYFDAFASTRTTLIGP